MAALTIPEELMLIAWHPDRGKSRHTVDGRLLAGAVLVDLAIAERIAVNDGRVDTTGASMTGDRLLDDALATIRADRKRRKVADWMSRLSSRLRLRDRVIDELVHQGVLRVERRRVLRIFTVTRHPVTDLAAWEAARRHIAEVLAAEGELPARDAALGGLTAPFAGSLVKELYDDRDARKAATRRARALSKGEGISGDVGDAIREAQAAAMAAITAAAAASAASSSASSN